MTVGEVRILDKNGKLKKVITQEEIKARKYKDYMEIAKKAEGKNYNPPNDVFYTPKKDGTH